MVLLFVFCSFSILFNCFNIILTCLTALCKRGLRNMVSLSMCTRISGSVRSNVCVMRLGMVLMVRIFYAYSVAACVGFGYVDVQIFKCIFA